jgi:hypothetical protein
LRVLKNKKAGQTLKVFSAILSQKLPILPSFCDFMPCLETFRVFFNTLRVDLQTFNYNLFAVIATAGLLLHRGEISSS